MPHQCWYISGCANNNHFYARSKLVRLAKEARHMEVPEIGAQASDATLILSEALNDVLKEEEDIPSA